MKGTQTKKMNIFTAGAIVLCLASAYGFLFYAVKSLNNEASLLRRGIALGEEKERMAVSEKILLQGLEEGRRELNGYFVEGDDPAVLIKRIEELVKKSGVLLSVSSLEPDKEKRNVLVAEMSLAGEFPEIFHFLSLFEQTPLGVTVKSAALGVAADSAMSGWEGNIMAEISHFISEK